MFADRLTSESNGHKKKIIIINRTGEHSCLRCHMNYYYVTDLKTLLFIISVLRVPGVQRAAGPCGAAIPSPARFFALWQSWYLTTISQAPHASMRRGLLRTAGEPVQRSPPEQAAEAVPPRPCWATTLHEHPDIALRSRVTHEQNGHRLMDNYLHVHVHLPCRCMHMHAG